MTTSHRAVIEAAVAEVEAGRPDSAISLISPLTRAANPSHAALSAHSQALKALGRGEEALAFDLKAVKLYPNDAIAWHNYAATLGDIGRAEEARRAVEKSFALGMDRPETLLIYARALHMMGENGPAERAFRMALERKPDDGQAASELAQLIWTNTRNVDAASEPLGLALMRGADEETVADTLIKLFEIAGRQKDLQDLCDRLLVRTPSNPRYMVPAARLRLLAGDLDAAMALIDRSLAIDPTATTALVHSVAIRLAAGRNDEALEVARRAVANDPNNQATWGWLATAARSAGSPEYEELFDYKTFVRAYTLDTPEGWESLEAFLADLAGTLRAMHTTRAEPLSQSVRGGTQTVGDISRVQHPVIQAFFAALERSILKYMRDLGSANHPFLSRNTGRYSIQAAWSVRLQSQGHHSSHFHPMGWISSAFYVVVPPSPEGTHEGWIQFGAPPYATATPQPPELFVQPKPGQLVLFPSYMWHGTVPFTAESERITIAFDAVPAPAR